MAIIHPFHAWRPVPESVSQIASPPYDVINSLEARQIATANPLSFIHVTRPEVFFEQEISPNTTEVFLRGKHCFEQWVQEGLFIQEESPSFYIYRIRMGDHVQTGILGLASVDDYFEGNIKIHELTRPQKEEERINHILHTRLHAEPVFLTYRSQHRIDHLIEKLTLETPVYDFTAEDDIVHTLWRVHGDIEIQEIIVLFDNINNTYVADGHHRTAASAMVGKKLKDENVNHTGNEPYNFFPAVFFPHDQLQVLDYNRVVKDLHGFWPSKFLQLLERNFQVIPHDETYKPSQPHHIGLYVNKKWYQLIATPNTYTEYDPVSSLDVTILSKYILEPLLSIKNQRTDPRIDFVGGSRGAEELVVRVDEGEMQLAFNLFPPSIEQIMDIADSDDIMPPKTTWFEPKLRSGLIVHQF